ncbi:OpgC domain-containing protein [Bradyrhizobium sp.]|uniref:OpgC domain-containing protein n=1 Tax=Bradyrhizobium sp. TaxID=376 RepID=UPI004037B7D3
MRIRADLPPPARDLRLDLFRGVANWAIFLGHIPNNAMAWITIKNYGFSDGADLFVFISGYTAALVYAKIMVDNGFIVGATRLFRRVWQLYVAHVFLFVVYLASVHYFAHNFDIPHLMDQFNVAGLMDRPVEILTHGLVLTFKPLNLDVLPLYIVLMASFPLVLRLMLGYPDWIMSGSVLLYFLARQFHWNLPSYPSGDWYFNPFTWQLLFVLGGWLALGGAARLAPIVRSRLVLVLSGAYLVFALVMTVSGLIPGAGAIFPRWLLDLFNPNDKTNLAPYRVLDLAALALLVVRFLPMDWPGLKSRIAAPLIKCGQQSLEVFCVGVFLSFIAHFVLEMTSETLLSQFLVSAAGLAIMTAVAYYRSWSKQFETFRLKAPAKRSS